MDASRNQAGMARTVWITIVGTTLLMFGASALATGAKVSDDALYLKIRPDFIVNLKGGSQTSFLMLTATVRGHDAEGIAAVSHHMSAIRHHLIMLLSEKSNTDMTTFEGKEATRGEVLNTVQKLLEAETGKPGVKDVLFVDIIIE